jgi:hypothetical protein
MVDDVNDGVERAQASLVRATENSGNLRNDLRRDILEAVSNLRNYFVLIQTNLQAFKQQPIKNSQERLSKAKTKFKG